MATKYVSKLGTDTGNTGPFLTIQYGVNQLESGDTLIVEDGIYREKIVVSKNNVVIKSKNLHGAEITGVWSDTGAMPDYDSALANGEYSQLVTLSPGYSNIVFDGFKVKNSSARGLLVSSANTVVKNCYIYMCFNTGCIVWATGANKVLNTTIKNCEISYCAMRYWTRYQKRNTKDGTYIINWPPPLFCKGSSDVVLEHNIVHDNGGEGIGFHACTRTTVRGNISYNNAIYQCYVDWAGTDSVIANNIFYTHSGFHGNSGSKLPTGLAFHDEHGGGENNQIDGHTRNLACYNNLIVNCESGISIFGKASLKDSIITNNTIVNCKSGMAVYSFSGAAGWEWTNTQIINNVVLAASNTGPANLLGLTFDNNAFSASASTLDGPNDVTITSADLVAAYAPITPEHFSPNNYKLTASSSCINTGTAI